MALSDSETNDAVVAMRATCLKHSQEPEDIIMIAVGFALFCSRSLGQSDERMIDLFREFSRQNANAPIPSTH